MAEVALLTKVTAVLAIALLVTRLARRVPAAARAMVLSFAFGVLLVLPVLTLVIPTRSIVLPIVAERATASVGWPDQGPTDAQGAIRAESRPSTPLRWRLPRLRTLLRVTWLLGSLIAILPFVISGWRLWRLRRCGMRWHEGEVQLVSLTSSARVRRRVSLFLHASLSSPLVSGLWRPAIGLPIEAKSWTTPDLERALVHELEHVRRGDWVVFVLSQALCACYWFHPLIWIAARHLHAECERACDDAVLRIADRATYAEQLILLARRLVKPSPVVALPMVGRSELSTRIRAMLDHHQRRGPASIRWTMSIASSAVVIALLVSPIQAVRPVTAGAAQVQVGSPVEARLVPRTESASPSPEVPTRSSVRAPAPTAVASRQTNPTTNPQPPALSVSTPNNNGSQPAAERLLEVPRFQEVSIKSNPSAPAPAGSGPVSRIAPGGHYMMRNGVTESLIAMAYPQFRSLDIVGAPDWIQSERYDIDALAGRETSQKEMALMLRTLLAERFQWVAHEEMQERPVYRLRLARTDGTLGPGLQRSDVDCSAIAAARREGRPVGSLPNGALPCMTTLGAGLLVESARPVSGLASMLSLVAKRTVIDETGLKGNFDFALRYSPTLQSTVDAGGPPNLSTAVEEQLGLTLQPDRGSMPVLVIDHIERPSEN